ncbi:aromatic amino acid DMT transporter YddG [Paraburkholderia tropica]|uniref:Drug/metabolite transporter (DMT)-like permease n=1 Tax=Paraburkholderia tropica TaxID=92647 RepID=A0ABX5MGS8_9BURK|nr:aromatic amino acid DMT transporter YddG [Paraburkholderia tropica]MDE1143957.1 aromatic amino acid DMT transporter YddG [Paraburkholderia tropica]PXX04103.1 drug/metabolite transporter (DMT)-like permease [Paraburkholderia tropica]PZW69486.1 drug/metabolite transporter (DMT)-like permease [Paraburkholderia tropica]QNB15606.1 drug/metabolite DMT transporter permease [Paraburkholderia tropica]
MKKDTATLIGLVAIMLWASIVALIRGVSESLGATGGAAMMYTVASVFLALTVGFPNFRQFPRNYLIWGSLLFVAYELCLSLSIGYADNGRQAIEVGMVNYLWPTFTLVSAIVFNKQKANLLVVPGFVLSMLGIGWVLGGDRGIDLAGMLGNVKDNPLSYGLAFSGALIWAAYCTVTARIANGKNGVTPFFMLVSAVLWLKFALEGGGAMHFDTPALIYLFLAAAAMGFGYAAWNIGILHGNATVLAGASYFIPVISAALAATLLHAPLSDAFWHGALMVCAGSILCWIATRPRRPGKAARKAAANEAEAVEKRIGERV